VATILVLDDDQVLVDLLDAVVEDSGHTTVVATAIEDLAPDTRPDLVVTDLMPLAGYQADAARRWVSDLRARFGVPVIVVTAHAEAVAEHDKLGADDVIAKPFDIDALVSRISALLDVTS
jgi:DNA-binding response OmpR family regulator